jgi:hypothetical protein
MEDKAMAAVRTDYEAENGLIPVGKLVHIVTVTYAYRGILEQVTPSHYILKDAFEVYETGDLQKYGKEQKGTNENKMFGTTMVERGACVRISVW